MRLCLNTLKNSSRSWSHWVFNHHQTKMKTTEKKAGRMSTGVMMTRTLRCHRQCSSKVYYFV